MKDSQQLILAAQGRDREAMQELVDRHLPGLRVFVRLRVDEGLRARESCSDLVQSTCREVVEHLDQYEYRGENSFRNWLFTTALNKIRQHRAYHHAAKRSPVREAALPSGERLSQLVNDYATIGTPSAQAIGQEMVERVEAAFDQMPEQYREVLTLSRIVGLSNTEIAAQMGRTEGATRTLLSRALVRLSALLDEG